jgi:hypothetical protein
LLDAILATQEVEIGRIAILGQPGQKNCETLPHLNGKKLGVVVHPSYGKETWEKSKTLSPK